MFFKKSPWRKRYLYQIIALYQPSFLLAFVVKLDFFSLSHFMTATLNSHDELKTNRDVTVEAAEREARALRRSLKRWEAYKRAGEVRHIPAPTYLFLLCYLIFFCHRYFFCYFFFLVFCLLCRLKVRWRCCTRNWPRP